MKIDPRPQTSELTPPANITPSSSTVINAIIILSPLTLLLIALYSGAIRP